MANQYAFTDWLAMDALRVLKNKLSCAEIFNMDYIPEYNKAFAVGETIRVPLPQRWVTTTGLGYQEQAINTQYTTVTVDEVKGVHFQWNSFDEALKLQRGDERIRRDFVEAPMAAIAQTIDSKAARWATMNTNNIVGALGTNPTQMSTYNSARARLVENACPPGMDNKRMIVSPGMQVSLSNTLATVFNPQSTADKVFRDGQLMENAYGFGRWYESMSLINTSAANWQTPASVTINGAGQSGSTLSLNCTSGDTFPEGTVISIADVNNVNPQTRESTGTEKQFVITQSVTASASTVTVNISPAIVGPGLTDTDAQYQNVSALPAASAMVTQYPGTTSPVGKSGRNGLAIDRNAFALVGVKLQAPENGGGIISSQKQDPQTGLSVRFVRAWDNIQSRWTNRYDVAFGFGNLYPDNCSVRVLSST